MLKQINSNMEQYAIYLRKSREDREAELMGKGETLARHEKIMLDLAKSKNLIIGRIYREIVSGDSISARPVMQELLQDVEDGMWAGVLVVEVERLARGNTIDQGIVADKFQFSDTLIITPTKTYDPNNEFDQEYFEFGLFMARREYKVIKRRLHNGTLSSVGEGKTVASTPPFGYERYKLKGKGYSLRIVEEKATVVRTIFEMYTNGKNLGEIVSMLDKLNIKPPQDGKIWYKSTIQKILTNITYTGKIRYIDKKSLKKRNENGKIISVKNPNPDVYIVDGLHEAIINEETFNKAQKIYKNNQLADTRTKEQFDLKNPLSTLLKCKVCGRTLKRSFSSNSFSSFERILCKNKDVSSSHLDKIEEKVFESLKILLNNYKLDFNKDTNNTEISALISNTNNQVEQLNTELDKINSQKSKLYDLLEQGIYDNNTFLERSKTLAEKIQEIKNKIYELTSLNEKYQDLKNNKGNIIPKIENVIETYPHANTEQKNKLLKSCIEKIEYYKPPKTRKGAFEITIYPRF